MRSDIQVLRGFAVLIVLLYHAKLQSFAQGFLGVDVFFVISGFLITTMVKESIERDAFSFREFYFRRAKRLLPAAYVTFLLTVVAAPAFLTSAQMADFREQLVGSLLFVANVVLRGQTGYFSGSADLKPLLHIWSLSLEEQYYFVLPALLVFTPTRFWKPGAILLTGLSLILCIVLVTRKPAVAFYMLPTRAWELGFGSVGALLRPTSRDARVVRIAFWPAAAMLLAVPLINIPGPHPGLAAVIACTATLLVLLRAHEAAFEHSAGRVAAKLGDISYSLYLVHWPILAFLNNAWIGDGDPPPLVYRVGAVALSLVLAWALHRYVETPCRRAVWRVSLAPVARGAAASVGIVLLAAGLSHAVERKKDYAVIFRPNFGLSASCDYAGSFRPTAECKNAPDPDTLVWGDSFAMALVPGISATAKVMQATKSACAPFLGIALMDAEHRWTWAAQCIAFNDAVLAQLKQLPHVHTVVLSSPVAYLLVTTNRLLVRERDLHDATPSAELVLESLRRTVDAIRAAGKRVVLVAPPPTAPFDSARCTERRETGLVSLGMPQACNISLASWKMSSTSVRDFLTLAERTVPVIRPSEFLCAADVCRTVIGGTPIYRDASHLSYDGSKLVATRMGLAERIRAVAR